MYKYIVDKIILSKVGPSSTLRQVPDSDLVLDWAVVGRGAQLRNSDSSWRQRLNLKLSWSRECADCVDDAGR
jgi:hypothetical protein